MKKKMKKTNIRTLVALLIASATFAACSSEDNEIQNAQPANPTEPQTYTMTIQATKATGGATTRGLYYGTDGALNVKWNEGEQVEVVQGSATLGTLKAKASTDGITTLTGELVGLQTGAQLKFYLHGASYDYTGQKGVLLKADGNNSIEEKYDYAFAATNDYIIDGSNVTVPSGINLEAQQSIVKFTLVDLWSHPINATSLKIDTKNPIIETINNIDPTGNTQVSKSMTITPTSGTNVIYVAIRNTEPNKDKPNDYTLTATTADGKEYTYKKTDVTFENGKYYEVTVKMSVTEWALGKILGADGNIYNTKAAAEAVATGNAVAMIAYVGSDTDHATYKHGLAIALADESSGYMNWSPAKSTCEGKSAVSGAAWLLPSQNQWKAMFKAFADSDASYTGLNTAITNAGGTALKESDVYWSSTPDGNGGYWRVYLRDGGASWYLGNVDNGNLVRACLAF